MVAIPAFDIEEANAENEAFRHCRIGKVTFWLTAPQPVPIRMRRDMVVMPWLVPTGTPH